MMTSISFQEFLNDYVNGNRIFDQLSIHAEDEMIEALTIEDTIFSGCHFEVSFSSTIFKHCFFIECNLKNVTFSKSTLEHVRVQGCLVEELSIENTTLDDFYFENNYAYGNEVNLDYIKKGN